MVSAEKLQLLAALEANTVSKFEPEIDDQGQITYDDIQEVTDTEFENPINTLDLLTDLGLLEKEYTIKVYVCPSCQTDGMQYITACPHCEATHTVRTTFFEHDQCGYTAPSMEFETDQKSLYHCPDCNSEFEASNLEITELHLCEECGERFANPNHRLWCRECFNLHSPEEAEENTLYEYTLSEKGKQWYNTQISARELLAEQFESRGFDVTIDTSVKNEENDAYPIHIYAEDDLLDQRIVADVHSTIDPTNIEYINTVAQQIDAQPVLLTTDTTISEEAIPVAQQYNLTILGVEGDGSIQRLQSFDTAQHPNSSIRDRLATAVNFSSWKDR